MKILHLASFDRWSGAAAPAFVEADALRTAGVEAEYAFVGGYLMEEKLRNVKWAYPLLRKGEGPLTVIRNVRAIRLHLHSGRFDVVHAHLTHDHWLARLAITGTATRLVRTFHSARALKIDVLSRRLVRSTSAVAVVHPVLARHPAIQGRGALVTPNPLEPQYVPEGDSARSQYGIPPSVPVVGVIGKVGEGRGFEDAVETFALVRGEWPEARMLIIGKGSHRPAIEALVDRLGLSEAVIWAGYHEDDLADHYRAMSVMLFTAAGSDEGHRAVIEASACGTPVAAYPLPGVEHVLGQTSGDLESARSSPDSLAAVVRKILSAEPRDLEEMVIANAQRFNYRATVDRLMTLYESALQN